ncbi:hypothetical protein [Jannaschia aquimarina]|uniref:Uncharacterized protein n=1 Tax=Jannaschia aquimarina TaxID=935700 RepID=A0A0D1EGY6_9RHOB|nr:hypothetical protein [Jannaschia aquimarina]KIT16899.1 hypothetical protein jaqu_13980 [Jannaschia aquimarina]SNT12027.1 hypothetical protein SAMN05421775_10650 [Jannaschia aquimarina]
MPEDFDIRPGPVPGSGQLALLRPDRLTALVYAAAILVIGLEGMPLHPVSAGALQADDLLKLAAIFLLLVRATALVGIVLTACIVVGGAATTTLLTESGTVPVPDLLSVAMLALFVRAILRA